MYVAVESGQCTDEFTAEIITSRLFPTPEAFWVTWVLFFLMVAIAAVSDGNE